MKEEIKDTRKTDAVWVMKEKCKSCGDCVWACLFGVISMRKDPRSLYGESVSVDRLDLCTGCKLCERVCPEPDCIHVKDKKDFVFPKKTKEALERRQKILANNGKTLPEDGGEK